MTAQEHPSFDTSVAHIARVYDYWLGGKDNFAADRKLAKQFMAADPFVTMGVRSNRAFLGRAVRYLAAEAAPDARIVYVDNDRCKPGCAHVGITER
jgi:S-adenosyl methyltransferase